MEIVAYEPDDTLRQILGPDVDLKKVFSPDKIAAVQKIIDDARDEFFINELPQVKTLQDIIKTNDPAKLVLIRNICWDIRSQARIFGFSFISNLCAQIVDFTGHEATPVKTRYLIISRFVDALAVAITNKVRDEGGGLEKELKKVADHLMSKQI